LGPVFNFAKYAVQACYLFITYPELHQKALLEIGTKETTHCLGEESYILSYPRESFEEQGYILIQKSFKKTQVI